MSLSSSQQENIEALLKQQIRRKLNEYAHEPNAMPFHVRLLGRDRMALYSFIQSINTMLGSSVFEKIAVIIAIPNFKRAVSQYKNFNNTISKNAQNEIQTILDDLTMLAKKADKTVETTRIMKVARMGEIKSIRRPRIDLFLETHEDVEFYFDLKTAKPNLGGIKEFKRTLLEWVAIRGAIEPQAKIHTLLAIPYNPYEPEPYARWTFQGMFDLPLELKVAEEFWDFLGGENTYQELLNVFEKVGIELRTEIDDRFSGFSN